MPKIEIRNLNVEYSKKKKENVVAISNLSTCFEDKKVNVVLGPSGCGKTSLLRCLLGMLDYTGDILFNGTNISTYSTKERNIGYVSQNIVLYPFMSVFNNIANPLKYIKCDSDEIKSRVSEVAKMLGIEMCLSRKPKCLSIGQCQRTAIARAIVKKPDLYVFDEAFCNLDQENRIKILHEMKQIFTTLNATVIFVTHSVKEALMIGDYIYVMDNGKMVDKMQKENFIYSNVQTTLELLKNGIEDF